MNNMLAVAYCMNGEIFIIQQGNLKTKLQRIDAVTVCKS